MATRKLPSLTPRQVVALQDALLSNADRLLTSAHTLLEAGNVALARSLAILGMEESGKAIAIHERRVQIAEEPEGAAFVNLQLEDLWSSHQAKLELVHSFLAEEKYWFGVEPSDPEMNLASLGTIKSWTRRHDKLKQRGFYVDVDKIGDVLDPTAVADEESLARVIDYVHQIGWQIRLGEHIEAKQQAESNNGIPPISEVEIEQIREMFADAGLDDVDLESLCQGIQGRPLNNDAYRMHLPGSQTNPFMNLGKPGYDAQTRELMRLHDEPDEPDDGQGKRE